jgi:hypothetical protein
VYSLFSKSKLFLNDLWASDNALTASFFELNSILVELKGSFLHWLSKQLILFSRVLLPDIPPLTIIEVFIIYYLVS